MEFEFFEGLYHFDVIGLCDENFFFLIFILFGFLFIVVHALLMYLNNFYEQRIKKQHFHQLKSPILFISDS